MNDVKRYRNEINEFNYTEEEGHAEDIDDIEYDTILDNLMVDKKYYNNLSDIVIITSEIKK